MNALSSGFNSLMKLVWCITIILVLFVLGATVVEHLLEPSDDEKYQFLLTVYQDITPERLSNMSREECDDIGGKVLRNPPRHTAYGTVSAGYRCSHTMTADYFATSRLSSYRTYKTFHDISLEQEANKH